MRLRWFYSGMLLLVVGLSGCGKKVEDPGPVVDETTRLGTEIDIKLTDWLAEPRPKLAEMFKETHDRVQARLKDIRANADAVALLPKLRAPLTIPVLRQAEFAPSQGISLPPYLKEGNRDSLVALHLARHGDVEAALMLVDPADRETTQQIEACRMDRNYPVEWTRLVGLTLQEAQLKMAMGEVEGATELVLLHRQLRTLLDAKTAAGPLGAALLPIGQRALKDALVEWRESVNKKTAVAEEIETTLKDWGEAPALQPTFVPGARRAAVAGAFSEISEGRLLAVKSPLPLLRVLDLQNLPVIGEGLEGALAWFDAKDQLTELWYLYEGRIGELFPDPLHLAHHLVDHGLQSKGVEKAGGLSHQDFTAGKLLLDVTRMDRSLVLGAVIRVADVSAPLLSPSLPADPRNFGAVHLGRTFEQTRIELAPQEAPGPVLSLKKADVLAQLKFPVVASSPAEVLLEKAGDQNLIDGLTIQWSAEDKLNLTALSKLLLPLWGAYGPSRFESAKDALVLSWEQVPLRLTLALPYNGTESPVFALRDQRGIADAPERLKEATAFDLKLRKARWEDKKPLVRLPRYLQWASLELGLSRSEVLKALPQDLKARPPVKTANGDLSVLFTSKAPRTAVFFPQQLVLRFGADDKLAEVRIRYQEGLAKPSAATPSLLDILKKAGMPESPTAPWLGLWADYPPSRPEPTYQRWIDDRTILTYQRDNSSTEVVLQDRPLESPGGVALQPFELLPRGCEAGQLGDTREALMKRWKISTPTTTPDGGLVLPQSQKSPYDLAVVWFEDNKTVRILAQHRARPKGTNEDYSADLQKVWVSDLDHLGVVRRIDQPLRADSDERSTVGYTWHDDRTRIHTLVQPRKDGPRLFTEWQGWPVKAPGTTVAKP